MKKRGAETAADENSGLWANTHHLTRSFSRFCCVIRIIFVVFGWLVSVWFQKKNTAWCSDLPAEKGGEKEKKRLQMKMKISAPDFLRPPFGGVKFNYRQFLTYHDGIKRSPGEIEHNALRKCTSSDRQGNLWIHTWAHTNAHLWIREALEHRVTHTCVCATGVAPLFSCDRKKRMDMKSSWMHTLNSSSFWPPVASEKRRRDWMMYLKMYSLACGTEGTNNGD